ncbi:hypothetical protein Lal_00003087 [Lupinus albus]|nr:hypothetical protein Lal_00003087 [Lupinus albus]
MEKTTSMRVIPGMRVDNAVNIMQDAHINGMVVVIICAQMELKTTDAVQLCLLMLSRGIQRDH